MRGMQRVQTFQWISIDECIEFRSTMVGKLAAKRNNKILTQNGRDDLASHIIWLLVPTVAQLG